MDAGKAGDGVAVAGSLVPSRLTWSGGDGGATSTSTSIAVPRWAVDAAVDATRFGGGRSATLLVLGLVRDGVARPSLAVERKGGSTLDLVTGLPDGLIPLWVVRAGVGRIAEPSAADRSAALQIVPSSPVPYLIGVEVLDGVVSVVAWALNTDGGRLPVRLVDGPRPDVTGAQTGAQPGAEEGVAWEILRLQGELALRAGVLDQLDVREPVKTLVGVRYPTALEVSAREDHEARGTRLADERDAAEGLARQTASDLWTRVRAAEELPPDVLAMAGLGQLPAVAVTSPTSLGGAASVEGLERARESMLRDARNRSDQGRAARRRRLRLAALVAAVILVVGVGMVTGWIPGTLVPMLATLTASGAATPAPPSQGVPAGTVPPGASGQVTVRVDATAEGGVAAVTVRAGEQVFIVSSGQWCTGGASSCGTADGFRGPAAGEADPLLAAARFGTLLARIADGDWRVVGADGAFTADRSGIVTLVVNDIPGTYGDNSGWINALVTVHSLGAVATPTHATTPAPTATRPPTPPPTPAVAASLRGALSGRIRATCVVAATPVDAVAAADCERDGVSISVAQYPDGPTADAHYATHLEELGMGTDLGGCWDGTPGEVDFGIGRMACAWTTGPVITWMDYRSGLVGQATGDGLLLADVLDTWWNKVLLLHSPDSATLSDDQQLIADMIPAEIRATCTGNDPTKDHAQSSLIFDPVGDLATVDCPNPAPKIDDFALMRFATREALEAWYATRVNGIIEGAAFGWDSGACLAGDVGETAFGRGRAVCYQRESDGASAIRWIDTDRLLYGIVTAKGGVYMGTITNWLAGLGLP